MTFEEAIEKINELFFEPCIPGYSIGDFDPEFSGQIEDLEKIIEELQATYAPKIKMGKRDIEILKSSTNIVDFWNACTEFYSDEELACAWLHPELIEVEQ